MINEHPHYSPAPEFDASLWRYMSVERAVDLLDSQTLYFARTDLLGDEHEGSSPAGQERVRRAFYEGATESYLTTGLSHDARLLRKLVYMSCWHMSDHESDLLWNRYGTPHGAVVRSGVRRLREGIAGGEHSFLLATVQYENYDDPAVAIWEGNAFNPLFVKRREFSGDREFRIAVERIERMGDLFKERFIPEDGIRVPIDPTVVVESILIHPRFESSMDEITRAAERAGVQDRLSRSVLSRPPDF